MDKEQLKKDILKTIVNLNSDISNYDRNELIKLLQSIADNTGSGTSCTCEKVEIDISSLENEGDYIIITDKEVNAIKNLNCVFKVHIYDPPYEVYNRYYTISNIEDHYENNGAKVYINLEDINGYKFYFNLDYDELGGKLKRMSWEN